MLIPRYDENLNLCTKPHWCNNLRFILRILKSFNQEPGKENLLNPAEDVEPAGPCSTIFRLSQGKDIPAANNALNEKIFALCTQLEMQCYLNMSFRTLLYT